MENIIKMVEMLILSITVSLRKIGTISEEKDYVPCEVELVRVDGRNMKYNVLIKNEFIDNDKVFIYNEAILKQVLLEYVYNKGNTRIRDQFSNTFNINEIKLLLGYFKYTSNLNQLEYIRCG